MIRGVLIGLLHQHILEARGNDIDDGKVVTLMSNDISNLANSGQMFHETWAQLMEVVVGTSLLARQVGWLWPIPIVFIFGEPLLTRTLRIMIDRGCSVLASKPPCCATSQAQTRQVEHGNADAYLGDKLHVGSYEEYQDARHAGDCSQESRRSPAARIRGCQGSPMVDASVQC